VLVLDACRYDAGSRLAEILNRGEPVRRAEVSPVRAPLPSITAIGMPFCLPGDTSQLRVTVESGNFRVTVPGFEGNLSDAGKRRDWLKQRFKLKDRSFLSVSQAADPASPVELNAKNLGRLVFVFGDELDDHDCQLKPFGIEHVLERYATVIRRLRAGGYNVIHVITDHGFFHWDPASDEKDGSKPDGNLRFTSRRAIVGDELKHASAMLFPVPGSDLECCVPRSVNSFKTYGRIGFFHGGATLQELVTPMLVIRWPRKARKTGVVIKPISQITSLVQRVEIAPAATQTDFLNVVDEMTLTRAVRLKVCDPRTGKAIFKGKSVVKVEPGGEATTIELEKVADADATVGSELEVVVEDADNDESLDRRTVILKVQFDDWD
jgi:PglZ domain